MKPFVFNQPLTRLRLLCAFVLLCTQFSFAQDVVNTPLDNQLVPIDYTMSPVAAIVKFTGTITSTNLVRIYQQIDGAGGFTLAQITTITGNVLNTTVQLGSVSGNFLHTFEYEVRGVNGMGVESVIKHISNVVGGDVYIINGQSNAVSVRFSSFGSTSADADAGTNRQWVRSYGSATTTYMGYTKQWGTGVGDVPETNPEKTTFGVGQWGMRMASQLVATTSTPVAIFNGAVFGSPINYFQKAYPEGMGQQNNYIRLRDRIAETGTSIIRGILWFQGEDDGFGKLTTAQYTTAFNQLYSDWTADYSPAHFYVYQVRYGCYYSATFGSTPATAFLEIMEAQRRFPTNFSNLTLISTNAADQLDQGAPLNFCHYLYTAGYQRIGNWARDVVLRDSYGIDNGVLIDPPRPASVSFTAASGPGVPSQVSIFLTDPTPGDIAMNGTFAQLASLFTLKKTGSGASFPITSIAISGSSPARIDIGFSGATSSVFPDSLSYLPHFGTGSGQGVPNFINTIVSGHGGLGLVNFKMLIAQGILPLDPLELSASKKDKGNALHWNVETNEDFRAFIVERSEDGQNFAEIASVNPTNEPFKASYDYLDQSPGTKCLYRIKGLKKAGNYIYSQVVAITSSSGAGQGLLIYPNPVNDRATFSLSLDDATTADLQLFSISGKLMSSRKITLQRGSNFVGVSEATVLNPGVYLLRVVTPDQVFTGRLIKSK